jgi:uncharacterized protein CbrC (UPF0167 family)
VTSHPTSTYHPDPLRTGSARQDDAPCLLCGATDTLKHEGEAFFDHAVADSEMLCIRCIVDGTAQEQLGAEFTVDFAAEDGWADVPDSVVDQVRHRTPAVFTWQSPRWLACCGDACVYLGVLDEDGAQEAEGGASRARLETLVGPAGDEPPSWYVFRCRSCDGNRVFRDEP